MSRSGGNGAFDREQGEPYEMPRGMPALMAVLLGGVGAWGASYLYYEAGEASTFSAGDRRTVFSDEAAPVSQTERAETTVSGEQVYASICQACHQSNGGGVAGAFPTLVNSEWVLGEPQRVAGIVLQGLQGPIDVQGQTYNGVMPPFGNQLSDQEIAAVVTYVRSSWGNAASAISSEAVAALRARLEGTGMLNGATGVRALAP